MSRFHIGPHVNELDAAMRRGENEREVLKKLHAQLAGQMPDGTAYHVVQHLVRKVVEGVMIDQMVNNAIAGKEKLPPYGIGELVGWKGDMLMAYPEDLSPVDFKGREDVFSKLRYCLDETVSTHVHHFFDFPAGHLEGLKREFGTLYRVQHMGVSAQKADITGGLGTTGRTMAGALRSINRHFPDRDTQGKIAIARQSFPAIVSLASIPLAIAGTFDRLNQAEDTVDNWTFMPNEDGNALRVNRVRLLGAYQTTNRQIGAHTGCPALSTLGEDDHAIRKLWDWAVDIAEQAGFFDRA